MKALEKVQNGSTLPSLSSWMDDWFNREVGSVFSNIGAGRSLPGVNIMEYADHFLLQLAVPGIKKSDFRIELDNDLLTISCEKEEETSGKDMQYTRREFNYTSFRRTFTLPEAVKAEKIDAEYKDGLLCLHLPKKEEAKRKPVRSIEIK